MRAGAEFFTTPSSPMQKRYEALRAYVVDHRRAEEIATAFGYSPATVYQMAAALRSGELEFFLSSKPGPKSARKQVVIRDRVLELRANDLPIDEIAAVITKDGTPVSHQTVYEILRAEGFERLPTRPKDARGAAARGDTVKAQALKAWPSGTVYDSAHAGAYLLVPELVEVGLSELIKEAGYPSSRALSSWHSVGSLALLKLLRQRRVSHVDDVATDPALGLVLGLTALPKTTHLTTYSYRVARTANDSLQQKLSARLRALGLATGAEGFNLDFHAIRHHGDDSPLEANYVPKRSQATRSVLTFYAQDHASTEMVYANADVPRPERATEIVAFADYWAKVTGADPGLLVFDSQLTTYSVLNDLSARGITWMTLRKRGKKVIEELSSVADKQWSKARIERAGRYRHPHIYERVISIKGIDNPVRQIAVKNIGRDEPTLLITNDITTKAKDLFARYAHRMLIENELAAYIVGFHLDALSSGVAFNVDLDTTLTVVAGNVMRLLARKLKRYEHATPDTLYRHFIDTPGQVRVEDDGVTVRLYTRTHTPVLLEAGFKELNVSVPWWEGRRLRFEFPP